MTSSEEEKRRPDQICINSETRTVRGKIEFQPKSESEDCQTCFSLRSIVYCCLEKSIDRFDFRFVSDKLSIFGQVSSGSLNYFGKFEASVYQQKINLRSFGTQKKQQQIDTMMNGRVLKEPLGFIRILEFPMAILAFAATAGFGVTTIVNYACEPKPGSAGTTGKYDFDWGYPFDLTGYIIEDDFCNNTEHYAQHTAFSMGAKSQAQFFVFTGVVCFFYILMILGVYLFWWPKYENDGRMPWIDFFITLILGVFWFIASCAWSSGVTTVKWVTSPDTIESRINQRDGPYPCNGSLPGQMLPTPLPFACKVDHPWNYAQLNVSLIAGFACAALWIANLWFIWKETPKYKAAHTVTMPATGPGMPPPGASTTGPSPFR